MLEWLLEIDTSLFVFMNLNLANPLFDLIMPVITYRWTLRAIFAAIVIYLLIFDGKRGRFAAVAAIVAVAVADQTASSLIKPWIGRIRPCHIIEPINLLVNCSQGLAFPSAHATNTAAVATILSPIYPRAKWYLIAFAVLVSYSRIAVGVHYPLDAIGGALVGVVAAACVYWMYRKAESRWLSSPKPSGSRESGNPARDL